MRRIIHRSHPKSICTLLVMYKDKHKLLVVSSFTKSGLPWSARGVLESPSSLFRPAHNEHFLFKHGNIFFFSFFLQSIKHMLKFTSAKFHIHVFFLNFFLGGWFQKQTFALLIDDKHNVPPPPSTSAHNVNISWSYNNCSEAGRCENKLTTRKKISVKTSLMPQAAMNGPPAPLFSNLEAMLRPRHRQKNKNKMKKVSPFHIVPLLGYLLPIGAQYGLMT